MEEVDIEKRFRDLELHHSDLLRQHEELKCSLSASHAELKLSIFDRLPMPIWACDRDCKIVFWNSGAARLYGYSADEAIGKDFVDLFVNKAEQDKARIDCIDIIDNDKPIHNMADDIDKYGNTRRLVTQCFAVYNVEGHSGLQVELAYEVQDIDRLQKELADLQAAYARADREREEMERKLLDVTKARALAALTSVADSEKEALLVRKKALEEAALKRDASKPMIETARAEIKAVKSRLVKWEQEKRKQIIQMMDISGLEELILSIERGDTFDA